MSNQSIKVNMVSETGMLPKGHGVYTAFLNMTQMLKARGIEVEINSREKCTITHIQTIGPYSLYKLLTNKPTVISAHVIPESFLGSLAFANYWNWEARKYLSFFYNRANLVLAVGPKVKDSLRLLGVKTRIEFFPNPVNEKHFYQSEKLRQEGKKKFGLDKKKIVVIAVGQTQPRKGVEDFIEIAKKLPNFFFVWVGGQPFKNMTADAEKIKKLIANKPENTRFIEHIPYEEMPMIYNACDIFFLPSYQETAGMVLVEAGSCGLPILVRDLEEYRMLYKENYLASDNDGFSEVIKELGENEKSLKEYKQKGLELSKDYSFAVLGDKLINFYKSLL